MGRSAKAVEDFIGMTKGYIKRIDEELKNELKRYSKSRFYGSLSYAIEGGKRMRPLIVFLSSEAAGGNREDATLGAVAVELLHTESIIHDDIIDDEKTRRGKNTFHLEYGYSASVLTADFVFGMILSIASRYEDPRVARELSNAALRMCEGEFRELKIDPSVYKLGWDEYISIISQKTASIFEVSSRLGAIIGGASDEVLSSLSRYGLLFGIAYQLQDDVMDWGKDAKVSNALVLEGDALEVMREKGKEYAEMARSELTAIPDSKAKRCLYGLCDFPLLRQL